MHHQPPYMVKAKTSAKSKIMNTVSQWISNPNSMSQILAIQGPPGIGKTSLYETLYKLPIVAAKAPLSIRMN